MTTALRAIGFDLDNTLYDQALHMRSFFREAAAHVAPRCSRPPSEIEAAFVEVWKRRTSYYGRLFDEVLEAIELHDGALVNELVGLYHAHQAELALFDGVREMLGRLRERYRLFMITDGNERMQRFKLESLALVGSFDELVITGTFGKAWSKPSERPYRFVMDRLGGVASDYAYVGDNPACDFFAARRLGMRTIRVMTEPFCSHSPPSEGYAADLTIARTIDLEHVLHEHQATV